MSFEISTFNSKYCSLNEDGIKKRSSSNQGFTRACAGKSEGPCVCLFTTKMPKSLSEQYCFLTRVFPSHGGDGFDGQCLQHFLVHISELFDVEAGPTGR